MTTQISTKSLTKEVTINSVTGMATITRAGLARRLNVSVDTLKYYLRQRGKTQGNQPLDEDSVLDTTAYYNPNIGFLNKLFFYGSLRVRKVKNDKNIIWRSKGN